MKDDESVRMRNDQRRREGEICRLKKSDRKEGHKLDRK
jgi:hypothetical protein